MTAVLLLGLLAGAQADIYHYVECLTAVSNSVPDVVISDIAMPGMDGLEMCRRLRRKYAQLPVVLMTGQTSDVDPERARHSGAEALLPKPFTMRQVLELLAVVAKSPRTR